MIVPLYAPDLSGVDTDELETCLASIGSTQQIGDGSWLIATQAEPKRASFLVAGLFGPRTHFLIPIEQPEGKMPPGIADWISYHHLKG